MHKELSTDGKRSIVTERILDCCGCVCIWEIVCLRAIFQLDETLIAICVIISLVRGVAKGSGSPLRVYSRGVYEELECA